MYDINDEQVTLLSLSTDGSLREVRCEAGKTRDAMCSTIGCHALALIALRGDVQMWVNGMGRKAGLAPNLYTAAVFAMLDLDRMGQVAFGTVVLATARGEDTASLDSDTREFVTGLVLSLGGRLAPSMRPAPMDGGRAWEWEFHGVQFRAESMNGSSVVRLHFRSEAVDSVWTVSHDRDTEGESAKSVAEEMFRDTTGGAP